MPDFRYTPTVKATTPGSRVRFETDATAQVPAQVFFGSGIGGVPDQNVPASAVRSGGADGTIPVVYGNATTVVTRMFTNGIPGAVLETITGVDLLPEGASPPITPGGGGAAIDDTTPSASTVFSSAKQNTTYAPKLTPTATKAAAYTPVAGDLAVMNVAAGATVLTLPTAPADKTQVAYRATGATAAVPMTITRGGTDTIGTAGATSASIPLDGESGVLQYDAANTRWLSVSNVKPLAAFDARFAAVGRRAKALTAFAGMVPMTSHIGSVQSQRSNATDTGCNAVAVHKATCTSGDFVAVYDNWDQGGGSNADAGPGNAVNVTMQVEYPTGVFTPMTYNGVSTVTTPVAVASGATVQLKASLLEYIAKGDIFKIHTYVTVTAGGKWCQPLLSNGNNFGSATGYAQAWLTGEGSVRGTGTADGSGATLASPVAGYMPGPSTVLSSSYDDARSLSVVGTSLMNGTISTRSVQQSWLVAALADQIGVSVLARQGGSVVADYLAGSTTRAVLRIPNLGRGATFYCEFGCNDLNTGGQTLATVQASLVRLWRLGRTRGAERVVQQTVLPWITSTDSYVTVANESASYTWEAARVALNQWLRAGAPLDASLVATTAGAAGAVYAGGSGHPLSGIVDPCPALEQTVDGGKWKVPGITSTCSTTSASVTLTNVPAGSIPRGIKLVGAGIPSGATAIDVSGTTVTMSAAATATADGVAVSTAFTSDGIHWCAYADAYIAARTDVSLLLA